MSETIDIDEAITHFLSLLERVMSGETIIIAKAGQPIAVLSPLTDSPRF